MGELADIYVAVKTRSKQKGIDFLNHFLPQRVESADEYELPQYSHKPEIEFDTAEDIMNYLENEETITYSLYWRNTDESNPNKCGMLFYTKDQAIVFGISRDAEIGGHTNTKNEDECLELMKSYFQTNLGYITYEDIPYESILEFKKAI